MNYRIICTIITVLIAAAPETRADGTGTTAVEFLGIDVSARTAATGGALSALTDGPISSHYNPAGLAETRNFQIAGMHSEWYQDLRYEYLGLAIPAGSVGTFGVSLTYLGLGEFNAYSASNTSIGNISAYDMSYGLSYGRQLSSALSLGVGVKGVNEKLDDISASGWAGDIGLQYRTQKFETGLAFMNLGPEIKYDLESSPLPSRADAGFSYRPTAGNLALLAGISAPFHGNFGFRTGLEYTYAELLVLRSGYNTADNLDDRSGMSFGAGFKIFSNSLDYAYNTNNILGGTHQISFVLRLGQPKEPLYSTNKIPQDPQPSGTDRSVSESVEQSKAIYLVCAGRYTNLENAQRHLESLKAFGFSPKIVPGGPEVYRVVLGKATEQGKAVKMKSNFEKKGVSCFIEAE